MTLAMIGIQGGYTVMKYCNQQCRVWVCENGENVQPQIHVFLNHNVGKMCSRAVSGPRFATVIWMRMSLGVFFAYSIVISQ